MEIYIQIFLIFEAITLLYSASISHLLQRPQDPQLVENAVNIFNDGLKSTSFLFKAFQVDSQEKQTDSFYGDTITFIIKETLCLKPSENLEKCPFKEDGVLKSCTAMFSGSEERRYAVSCHTVDAAINLSQGSREENPEQTTDRRHRSVKLFNSGKKAVGTNFLDIGNKSTLESHFVASCIPCIIDLFKPSTGRR